MKNLFKKPLAVLLLLVFSISFLLSCGKKGPLEYPGERKKPDFDKVIEEE